MKLLHIYSSPHDGGGTVYVAGMCDALAKRGHSAHLTCRPNAKILHRVDRSVVQARELPLKNGADIVSLYQLVRQVRQNGIELINAHNGRDYPLAYLTSRLTKTACVFWRHYYRLNRNPITRMFFKDTEMVIAVSEALCRAIRDELRVSPSRAVAIPNWVEPCQSLTPAFAASVKTKFGLNKPHTIAVIGSIYAGKGQKEFVEMALALLEKRRDLCFLIVGVTEQNRHSRYFQDLHRRIDIAGRQSDFRFIDWQSDLSQIFAVTRITVAPSHNEAFGRVAAESLAAGVPVVASDTTGLREIIRDGETGFLAKPGAISEWVGKIEHLLDDDGLHNRFSRDGRQDVSKRFGRERVVGRIEEAYRGALYNRGRVEPR